MYLMIAALLLAVFFDDREAKHARSNLERDVGRLSAQLEGGRKDLGAARQDIEDLKSLNQALSTQITDLGGVPVTVVVRSTSPAPTSPPSPTPPTEPTPTTSPPPTTQPPPPTTQPCLITALGVCAL